MRSPQSWLGLMSGLGLCAVGCTTPSINTSICVTHITRTCGGQSYDTCLDLFGPQLADTVDTRVEKLVDVLFVIDNSSRMGPKQKALAAAMPSLLQKLDGIAANYNIGVVTTDVGTLPPGKSSFPGSPDPRCNTQKGDDGLLQNIPCSARIPAAGAGDEFAQICANGATPLCSDPSFVPTDRWIVRQGTTVNVKPSSPGALSPAEITQRAFQCIGLVGDTGCTVESPLESMKRALDGHLSQNKGFLRDNSLLAVLFLTDEDDCSVQLVQRGALDPQSRDCGTANPDPDPSCFNLDYRCAAKSIQCDESMTLPGVKHNCSERPGSLLEPIDKYAKFLSALRPPSKLVLAGIWSPSLLDFQSRGGTGDGKLDVVTSIPGDFSTNVLNRGTGASGACFNPDPTLTTQPDGVYGQAQLRLSAFVRKFEPSLGVEQNVCDVGGYAATLRSVGEQITRKVSTDCLPVLPSTGCDGQPLCSVGEVEVSKPDSLPANDWPVCSAACCQAWATASMATRQDPGIAAACSGEARDCYCAVTNPQNCRDTAVAGVWRVGNAPPPSDKSVQFRCAGSRPPPSL